MERFEPCHHQRVVVTNVERLAARHGSDAARWLHGRPGVVLSMAKSDGGAWVRVDETLPPVLRGAYAPDHPLGRDLLLFPWGCETAHDRGYAPFHRNEYAAALNEAYERFDENAPRLPSSPGDVVSGRADGVRPASVGGQCGLERLHAM